MAHTIMRTKKAGVTHLPGSGSLRGSNDALIIVIPYYPLWKGIIVIQVNEGPADTDTPDTAFQGSGYNLVAVCAGITADIHGPAPGVCGVPRTAHLLFVGHTPEGAVKHQRNPGCFPHPVKEFQEARIHLLN